MGRVCRYSMRGCVLLLILAVVIVTVTQAVDVSQVEGWSEEQVAEFLRSHAIKQKVIDTLVEEEVDGSAFVGLTAEMLGVPPFSLKGGSISKIMKLVAQVAQPAAPSHGVEPAKQEAAAAQKADEAAVEAAAAQKAAKEAEEAAAAQKAAEEAAAAQKAAEEAAAAKMPNEQAPADAAKVDEVHKLYKDLADGRVDDPELAAKIDKMVPTPDPAADTLTQQATKPNAPRAKKKIGLKGFGILKKKEAKAKPAAALASATPDPMPDMGVAAVEATDAAAIGKMDRKMKLEMLLKDSIRTVRLKRSRSILREAFKNGKEENFDDAWQTQILKRILKRNQYTQDSIGEAFNEFVGDPDIKSLRRSYEEGMVHFRNLVMEETYRH